MLALSWSASCLGTVLGLYSLSALRRLYGLGFDLRFCYRSDRRLILGPCCTFFSKLLHDRAVFICSATSRHPDLFGEGIEVDSDLFFGMFDAKGQEPIIFQVART